MLHPKRILVTKFRAMGDTVLLTAALKELHRNFPKAQIEVAAPVPWIELLEGFPGVTKLWPVTWHSDRAARTKAATRLIFQLRKESYDIVCGFHASPGSAIVAFSTGAKIRAIHFHGFKSKNMYSTQEIPGKGIIKPVIERDIDTIRGLGLEIPTGAMPKIFLTDAEKRLAKEEFYTWGLTSPVLGVALGASRPTKVWPLERFAEIAQKWVSETRGSVLVITGPGEEPLVTDFFKALPATEEVRKAIQVMPHAGVRVLAARISQLNVLLGNDSGPRHLATALDIPTVTVFGPEHPLEWHPYPQDMHPRLFLEPLKCRNNEAPGSPPWCGLRECVIEAHQCMNRIGTDQVLKETFRVYEAYGKNLGI